MPQDYRRFNGPEDSVPYQRFTKEFVKTYEERYAELLDENGKRRDGVAVENVRETCSFYPRTNVVSQAKGSAYVELKNTKVVCSVFDPREIPHLNEYSQLGQIFCEVKFAPFACKGERRNPVPEAEEKALSVFMKQALEACVCRYKFPNFQIDVFVYILENGGSCLAAALNCAGLALVDAVVPMYGVISSVTMAVIDNQMFIDPNYEEEALAIANTDSKANHGTITLCWMKGLSQVCDFRVVGSMDVKFILEALKILEKECTKILPIIQRVPTADVLRNVEEKKLMDEESKQQEELLKARLEEWSLQKI